MMKDYFLKNYRIFLSIIFSFVIVLFIVPYFLTPGKLTRTLGNIFNSFKSFNNLDFSFSSNEAIKQSDNVPNNSFNLPTVYQKPVTIIPTNIVNEDVREIPNKIIPHFTPIPTKTGSENPTPTKFVQPTKSPKPTRPPDVFPIDPSLARYGKTTDEVFTYASQKTCVPMAVLKGIAYIESGGFFDVVSPKYFLLYNSYNWWKSEFLTEEVRACSGYDYDSNTGLIPSDSKFAGYKCRDGSGSGLVTMGPLSVSDHWEGQFKKPAATALGVAQTDQRVILDAIAIVGMSVKSNVKPANCNSWTAHEVAKAACSYYGSCGFKDGTYYCNTFCRNYKTYGGKADCQGAVNQMQDNCWQ